MLSFFKRDYRYYVDKGEKYLQQGRHVDAKFSFVQALEKLDGSGIRGIEDEALLRAKVAEINNTLAELNLKEAEHAITSGNHDKADEHLQMVLELAEDVALREKAEKLTVQMSTRNDFHNLNNNNNGCAGCKTSHLQVTEHVEKGFDADSHLSAEEKFELLIGPLPAPLPGRYASLGKDFACCYLLIHDGEDDKALPILEQLSASSENDILFYELALIKFRQNDLSSCDKYLKRAIAINPENPLCYLALVQLRIDGGQCAEAIPLLEHMIASNLLANQARIMLGDVHMLLGGTTEAVAIFTQALSLPGISREAAERLYPLLVNEGRLDDAEYIKKQYLKKCC